MYGEEVAILAGDALLALAFEYVARETRGVSADRIVRVRARSSAPALLVAPYASMPQTAL